MKLNLLYFASVRERLGIEREGLELPAGIASIEQLEAYLATRGDAWHDVFSGGVRLLAAVNQTLARRDAVLAEGDEVAFFPPVTGG